MWYANYLMKKGSREQKIYAFNVIAGSIDLDLLFKQAESAAVVSLTPDQQDYISKMYDDIAAYAKKALLSKVEKGYANNFEVTREVMSDVVQEAVLKAMEVIPKYWAERNPKELWGAIKTSISNIVDRIMNSAQPNIYEESPRQYDDVREPLYANPHPVIAAFFDKMMLEYYGDTALAQFDEQEMAEAIDHVYRENQAEILNFANTHRQELSTKEFNVQEITDPKKFAEWVRKQGNRYKSRKVLELGGRSQVESRGVDDIVDLGLGDMDYLEPGADVTYNQEALSTNLRNILAKAPDDIQLTACLVYDLNPVDFGITITARQYAKVARLIGYDRQYDDANTAWEKLVRAVNTKGGKRVSWSSLKPVMGAMFGGDSVVAKMQNVKALQEYLRRFITKG